MELAKGIAGAAAFVAAYLALFVWAALAESKSGGGKGAGDRKKEDGE